MLVDRERMILTIARVHAHMADNPLVTEQTMEKAWMEMIKLIDQIRIVRCPNVSANEMLELIDEYREEALKQTAVVGHALETGRINGEN